MVNDDLSPISEKNEREFLHAIANKITIAHGMISLILSKSKDKPELKEEIAKLEKSFKAIEDISQILKTRRAEIISFYSNH